MSHSWDRAHKSVRTCAVHHPWEIKTMDKPQSSSISGPNSQATVHQIFFTLPPPAHQMTDLWLPFLVCVLSLAVALRAWTLADLVTAERIWILLHTTCTRAHTHNLLLLHTFSCYPSFSWTVVCLCASIVKWKGTPPGSPTPRGAGTEWLKGGKEGREGNPEQIGPFRWRSEEDENIHHSLFSAKFIHVSFWSFCFCFRFVFFFSLYTCHLVNNSEVSDALFKPHSLTHCY